MASLKEFAVMMVFVSVAGFIYCFLLPAGGVSRMAKNLLSAIFLLLVLSPLFSFVGRELSLPEHASAAYTENGALYAEYRQMAAKEAKVIFGGRLGEYKYYDMDAVIAAALERAEQELG